VKSVRNAANIWLTIMCRPTNGPELEAECT
jgi:hypothetical protein